MEMYQIKELFKTLGFGEIKNPITSVSGGFMHRMYKVVCDNNSYAVKHLNSEIMKRPEVMKNYEKAEILENKLESAGIPIVPALTLNGKKLQEFNGEYFYIFKWQEGKITDWNAISKEQCELAGNIQGRIHAIDPKNIKHSDPELSTIDWSKYIDKAKEQNSEIYPILVQNKGLLEYAQDQMNHAREKLPDIECIIDDDMDPKNVMWYGGEPIVIDLECLDYGNPVSSVIQLSLQWAGITTCNLDYDKMRAFFDGYFRVNDIGFKDYAEVFGLAYTWIEWLEYNIERALGKCSDEVERKLGIDEVRNTISRINYIYGLEEGIKELLRHISC